MARSSISYRKKMELLAVDGDRFPFFYPINKKT